MASCTCLSSRFPPGAHHTAVDGLLHCIEHRQRGIMATVISTEHAEGAHRVDGPLGRHVMVLEDGSEGPSSLELPNDSPIHETCQSILKQEIEQEQIYLWQTHSYDLGNEQVEVLFEIVRPPVRLYIFGEGHDVGAVVAQAKTLGWEVVIVGRKPVDVLRDRFPDATDHIFLMHPAEVTRHVTPDSRSAALVMNHTYIRDKALMDALLHSDMPYTGMLGPRERTETMLEELANENTAIPESNLNKLFGPVGLDIGTETPEEIALSAIAEIQAFLHRRNGGYLRARKGPIHASRNPIEAFH